MFCQISIKKCRYIVSLPMIIFDRINCMFVNLKVLTILQDNITEVATWWLSLKFIPFTCIYQFYTTHNSTATSRTLSITWKCSVALQHFVSAVILCTVIGNHSVTCVHICRRLRRQVSLLLHVLRFYRHFIYWSARLYSENSYRHNCRFGTYRREVTL